MPEAFDAYYKWLAIPPGEQPPNHYRLLGVPLFESDTDVIANSADKQMAHVKSYQAGPHATLSQKILNQIAAAKICLLVADQKEAYDDLLRRQLAPAQDAFQRPVVPVVSQIEFELPTLAPGALKKSRRTLRFGSQFQMLATAGAVIVALLAIIIYSSVNKPVDTDRSSTQAAIESSPRTEALDSSKQASAEKPTVATPTVARPIAKPAPDPVPLETASKPKPAPHMELPAEAPVAPEAPEKIEERLNAAFSQAKTAGDFELIATDTLALMEQASTEGNVEMAKRASVLALSAARKSGNDALIKRVTLRILESQKNGSRGLRDDK